jgi:hypothetical protein
VLLLLILLLMMSKRSSCFADGNFNASEEHRRELFRVSGCGAKSAVCLYV